MYKVKVLEDQNKNVIHVSENPEIGYIRVEQEALQYNETGWLKSVKRTALIHGSIEDLKKAGYKAGMEIPGKIVVLESLTPFDKQNPDRNLKVAGDTGVVCRVDDQPIYRQTFFTPNLNSFDELITHTNTEEIREVLDAQRMMKSISKIRQETADKAVEL